MEGGSPHTLFIALSYAATFLVVGGLIAWAVVDARLQRRALAELEARGARRRGGAAEAGPARRTTPAAPRRGDAA